MRERTISSYEFNTSIDAFIKKGKDIRYLYPDSIDYIENPKGTVLNNIWCWSKADSDPYCKVVFFGESQTILLSAEKINNIKSNRYSIEFCFDSIGTRKCSLDSLIFTGSFNKREWLPQADSLLMFRLGSNVNKIKSIRLVKEEETDRLWGVMEGMYAGIFVGIAAMILELPVSGIMNKEYNWNHVLYSSLISAAGFSVYRVVTYDINPRTLRVIINVKHF